MRDRAVGARLPRHEDPRLLRGRGQFGDDISVPGPPRARIVRTPSGHGLLREPDVTAAARAPGITTIVTGISSTCTPSTRGQAPDDHGLRQ